MNHNQLKSKARLSVVNNMVYNEHKEISDK